VLAKPDCSNHHSGPTVSDNIERTCDRTDPECFRNAQRRSNLA
jgi:hypothetical protein